MNDVPETRRQKNRRDHLAAAFSSVAAVGVIALALMQGPEARCEQKRSDDILYKIMILEGSSQQFGVLWAFQFLSGAAIDHSRDEDRMKATGLTANEFKEEQQNLQAAFAISCDGWTVAIYAMAAVSLLFQLLATWTMFRSRPFVRRSNTK